jgi:hypothetical protein
MPKLGITHAMSFEQRFTFCRGGSVSPLLCICSEFVFIARFPVLEVDSSICRLVVAIACTTVKMTTDSSQRSDMSSSRKVTNNQGNGASSNATVRVTGGFGEFDTTLP